MDELIHQTLADGSPCRVGLLKAENSKLAEAVLRCGIGKQALRDSPGRMQADFDKLDTDGDGVVSKDELAAALVSPAEESPSASSSATKGVGLFPGMLGRQDRDSTQDTKDEAGSCGFGCSAACLQM